MSTPTRGEVYMINIPREQTVGREQYDYRPWLVLSPKEVNLRLDLVVAVPLTTREEWDRRYYQHRIVVPLKDMIREASDVGLPQEKDGLALAEQVRALSIERFNVPRCCRIERSTVSKIENAFYFVLGMPIAAMTGLVRPLVPPMKTN